MTLTPQAPIEMPIETPASFIFFDMTWGLISFGLLIVIIPLIICFFIKKHSKPFYVVSCINIILLFANIVVNVIKNIIAIGLVEPISSGIWIERWEFFHELHPIIQLVGNILCLIGIYFLYKFLNNFKKSEYDEKYRVPLLVSMLILYFILQILPTWQAWII